MVHQAVTPYYSSKLQGQRNTYFECVKKKSKEECSSELEELQSQMEALYLLFFPPLIFQCLQIVSLFSSEKTRGCREILFPYVAVLTLAKDDPTPFERAWIHCMESEE